VDQEEEKAGQDQIAVMPFPYQVRRQGSLLRGAKAALAATMLLDDLAITEFSAEIGHITRPSTIVGDTLSRPVVAELSTVSAGAAGIGPPEAQLVAAAGHSAVTATLPPVDITELSADQDGCTD
jgi:hypothetical protein